MRATFASLIALSLTAPAFAQTPTPAPTVPTTAAPVDSAPMAAPSPAATPAAATPPAAMAPAAAAPASMTPGTATPPAAMPPAAPAAAAPTVVTPGTRTAPGVAPVEPAAPPGPPPAPTDPAAIALISTLESVCAPAVSGGNMDKLARAGGYRRSGENYVMHGKGFQLTVLAPGSNPQTCHVDIVSPIDPEAAAKPLVVALHNWAAVTHGYTLYRNDKNVTGGQELTTRSWELSENGKNEALVLTTFRKADGTPSGGRETSQMLFSTTGTPAS